MSKTPPHRRCHKFANNTRRIATCRTTSHTLPMNKPNVARTCAHTKTWNNNYRMPKCVVLPATKDAQLDTQKGPGLSRLLARTHFRRYCRWWWCKSLRKLLVVRGQIVDMNMVEEQNYTPQEASEKCEITMALATSQIVAGFCLRVKLVRLGCLRVRGGGHWDGRPRQHIVSLGCMYRRCGAALTGRPRALVLMPRLVFRTVT